MTTISKENSAFYYRLPIDRLQRIMTFGWCAVWNDNLYTDVFDIDLSKGHDIASLPRVFSNLQISRDQSFEKVSAEPHEKGEYKKSIEDIKKSFEGNGFASANIEELKEHFLLNEDVPESIKQVLRQNEKQ